MKHSIFGFGCVKRRLWHLGLALLATACAASVADPPDVPVPCDVREAACAESVVRYVAYLYEHELPDGLVVTTAEDAPFTLGPPGDAGWSDLLTVPFDVLAEPVDDTPWRADPQLQSGPMPSAVGDVVHYRHRQELRFVYPPESDPDADPAEAAAHPPVDQSRSRLAGLVLATANWLRQREPPPQPIDTADLWPTYYVTRTALRLGVGYTLLAQLEAAQRGVDPDDFDAAALRAEVLALADTLWDSAETPARSPQRDVAYAAGLRYVLDLRGEAGDWRAVEEALGETTDLCLRQLVREGAASCAALELAPEVAEAPDFLAHYAFELTAPGLEALLRPTFGDEAADLAIGLAGHLGRVRLNLGDGRLLREDVFRFDAAAQAGAFGDTLAALLAEKWQVAAPTEGPDGVRRFVGPNAVALLQVKGSDVFFVQAEAGIEHPEVFLNALQNVHDAGVPSERN